MVETLPKSVPLDGVLQNGHGPVRLLDETIEVLRPLHTVGLKRSTRAKYVGGKAITLGKLAREGFPVPEGWVLDARHFTRALAQLLPSGHDVATLLKLAGTKAGVDRAARACERILEHSLSEEVSRAIEDLWSAIEHRAPWGLAVRSSATCEDGEETSLAGLATTVLGVRGVAQIQAAVRQVWASAMLPRAIDYLAHAGVRDFAMAVLMQPVVKAEAAGVLFTSPPDGLEGPHWKRNERLVNATFGLGAPVVEGARSADTVRIAREDGTVTGQTIVEKKRALVVGAAGLEEVAIAPTEWQKPALGAQALSELSELAHRIEELERTAMDIEFAVDSEGPGHSQRVLVLQARPLSGRGFPAGGDADTVWSRANVGEALPGAATPLTWSIAQSFSDGGFRRAFAALGCKVPRGEKLVANIHGRFYLNLSAFMRIAAQVPGLGPRALLERSGGASESAIALLEQQTEGVSHRGFLMRLPFAVPRLLAEQARLERSVSEFDEEALAAQRALYELDLTILPDDALTHTLKRARALLERTGILMLTCASASLASHLALCAALRRVGARRASARTSSALDPAVSNQSTPRAWAEQLAHALAGGVRDLDSAELGIALARVAQLAQDDAPARDKLSSGRIASLAEFPEGPTKRAFEEFLTRFGDRAVREAELATPRWREDPTAAIGMLVAAVKSPDADPERALARARALADRELARLETRVSRPELALVRLLVGRNQHFTRLREHMRTWVTRVLGMLRFIALDIDQRLRRIDPSLTPGSVFFCTYDELLSALSSGRAEVGHVVRLRRAEYARDRGRPDPPPTFIGRPPPVTMPPATGTRMVGLPASGGVVEGRARVFGAGTPALHELEAGEILVSRTTDVSLSPLFLIAAAVVTELGGPLSHAAVVAREYGVPAVVNVPGATQAIRTGDRLRVDGDRGTVERLDGGASS